MSEQQTEEIKQELELAPVEGELLPVGKMLIVTAEQVNALAVIKNISKVEVLANAEETAAGIVKMKASYLPIIKKANQDLSEVVTQADFKRAQECRLSIRTERLSFTKTIDAELAERKLFIENAVEGKKLVESAFKSLETELDAAEKPVDERLKAAAAAKKALADAIAKLKSHIINPLLPAADIEAAIEIFRWRFCESDYQESQEIAEAIFESKMTEFEEILAAAVVREDNERKIKEQEKQAQQRANIAVSFPIDSISCYGGFTSVDIQVRIDLLKEVDMTAFELVLTEAETAKQSCLNVLAAFLPMAVAREQEEARKEKQAAKERAEREAFEAKVKAEADAKQAAIDVENARLAQIESDRIAAEQAEIARQQAEIQHQQDAIEERLKAQESAVIAIINDDVSVAKDVVKIISESCVECVNNDFDVCNNGDCSGSHYTGLDVIEVVSEPVVDDWISIPVKHLKALIQAASNGLAFYDYDEDEANLIEDAISFAESLI